MSLSKTNQSITYWLLHLKIKHTHTFSMHICLCNMLTLSVRRQITKSPFIPFPFHYWAAQLPWQRQVNPSHIRSRWNVTSCLTSVCVTESTQGSLVWQSQMLSLYSRWNCCVFVINNVAALMINLSTIYFHRRTSI